MTSRDRSIGLASALGLALAQFRLIVLVLGTDYGRSADMSLAVIQGHPAWRVDQSRLLSPWLVLALTRIFPSFVSAHVAFSIAALVLAGWLAWRLGFTISGQRGAIVALLTFHVAFAFLLSRPWLMSWDYVDAIVFLAFTGCVVSEAESLVIALLFAVGVLNHEIAFFIALYLIVDPPIQWLIGGKLNVERTLIGIGCLAAGIATVEFVRLKLLIEETGPKIFLDAPAHASGSFHFTLGENVAQLASMFTTFNYALPILVPTFLVAVLALAVTLARRDPRRFMGLAVTNVAMIGALLTFGRILETRIYVVLIPLLVFGCTYLAKSEPNS
jgi:hypothetical protein